MVFENVSIKDIKLLMSQLVKMQRKKAKLTQQELAEKLDLSRITIQHLEAGKNFTIDTLLKVLQHFDLLGTLHQHLIEKRNEYENITSLY